MHDYNNSTGVGSIRSYHAGFRGTGAMHYNPHDTRPLRPSTPFWGGARARRLLHAAYTISFICLLRFDEVLRIQCHDIEVVSKTCIKLTLPFRKTSQFGGTSLQLSLHVLLCGRAAMISYVLISLLQKSNHFFFTSCRKRKLISAPFELFQSG